MVMGGAGGVVVGGAGGVAVGGARVGVLIAEEDRQLCT